MSKLVSLSAFSVPNYKVLSPSVNVAVNSDCIVFAKPASTSQIALNSAIKTEVTVSEPSANSLNSGTYLVAEAVSAIVTASA